MSNEALNQVSEEAPEVPRADEVQNDIPLSGSPTQTANPGGDNVGLLPPAKADEGAGETEGTGVPPPDDRKSSKEPTPKASGTGTERRASLRKGSRRGSMFADKGTEPKFQESDLKDTLAEFFSSAPKEHDEKSTALKPLRRPKLIYENTYRLDSIHPFSPSRVQSVVENILEDMLSDFKYCSKTSGQKAMEVAERIRRNVLAFRFDRYKICVLVTISPLNRQGFFNGFRCLWDANRDSYAHATVRNPWLFAVAICYGIYFE